MERETLAVRPSYYFELWLECPSLGVLYIMSSSRPWKRAQTTDMILEILKRVEILEIQISNEIPSSMEIPPSMEILPSIDIPAIYLPFSRGFPSNTHRTCLFSCHVRD
jgi:hypothetical protein